MRRNLCPCRQYCCADDNSCRHWSVKCRLLWRVFGPVAVMVGTGITLLVAMIEQALKH
jgi:hypothetical protein